MLLAEWDPYTRPILAEVEGEVVFEDLVDGASVAENTDETTGFTKRVVIDWRGNQRGEGLKPALAIARGGSVAKVDRGGEARPVLGMFLGGAYLADVMLYCRNRIYPLGLPNGVSHFLAAILGLFALLFGLGGGRLPPKTEAVRAYCG